MHKTLVLANMFNPQDPTHKQSIEGCKAAVVQEPWHSYEAVLKVNISVVSPSTVLCQDLSIRCEQMAQHCGRKGWATQYENASRGYS